MVNDIIMEIMGYLLVLFGILEVIFIVKIIIKFYLINRFFEKDEKEFMDRLHSIFENLKEGYKEQLKKQVGFDISILFSRFLEIFEGHFRGEPNGYKLVNILEELKVAITSSKTRPDRFEGYYLVGHKQLDFF
jgi:hypothetical protein